MSAVFLQVPKIMQQHEIKSLIESSIPNSSATVEIEGSHVHLNVVSSSFEGLSPVKRQQMVNAPLMDSIAQGIIHAVHIKTSTP